MSTAPPVSVDPPAPTTSPWRRLLAASSTYTLLILLVMIGVFSALRPDQFATSFVAQSISVDVSVLLVLAVGSTFVIITAGIDLSIGSVLVLAGVLAVKAMDKVGDQGAAVVWTGLGVALVVGLAAGVVNGILITKAKVPPLIVTLGTLGIALGLAQIITTGVDLTTSALSDLGFGELGGVRYLTLIAAGVTVVAIVVLHFTVFGRHTYAIGSNPEASRRAGINVDRHLIAVYGLSGLLAGLAGFMSLAKFSTTTIGGHSSDNLQAIAGVVLGGTSLFGGIGTIVGSVIGVFIPAVLQTGFVILGVQAFWQQVAVGAVLIAAVYFDQLKRRSRNRS